MFNKLLRFTMGPAGLLAASLAAALMLTLGASGSSGPDNNSDSKSTSDIKTAQASPPSGDTTPAPEHKGKPAHWGYSPEDGPSHWKDLDPAYAPCGSVKAQSPINLSTHKVSRHTAVEFSYKPSALTIVNNGHTVQTNFQEGSFITADGVDYNLQQFHFHHPSEHRINGKRFPLEMHMVHTDAAGHIAVVALLFKTGAPNAALEPVFSNLPAREGLQNKVDAGFNAANFLPENRRTYCYTGSLTTPPCSEGVRWFVMADPVIISPSQLAAFTQIFPNDHRPLEPLNHRTIVLDTAQER